MADGQCSIQVAHGQQAPLTGGSRMVAEGQSLIQVAHDQSPR